ncbi:chorismate--pyruvate lyase family protein [Pseudohaliea rubra]|uniref:Probable chorismate pyruvate-lyase n=1 Tax=Pseudohaliea rubra DSM 19751 TaxID=1265313 RepID=A0A095VP72_9GAMM|nr:chorismate lyase [Pseudohaliea rubra]KGE03155.1 Chorismate--pyruvate lyase [Pseudohaliea rubra DSM 19751]
MIRVQPDSSADPAWRSPVDPRLAGLHGLRPWLLDDGSLTRRLVASGGTFRVERLSQRWSTPRASEARVLASGPRQQALVREVALRLDGEAVVFARSVFPYASLCGRLAHLRKLQGSSLGAILFSAPDMRRSPFQVALLSGDSRYLPRSLRQENSAWARRSVFRLHGQRLLVSEVFLMPFRLRAPGTGVERGSRRRVSAAILPATQ